MPTSNLLSSRAQMRTKIRLDNPEWRTRLFKHKWAAQTASSKQWCNATASGVKGVSKTLKLQVDNFGWLSMCRLPMQGICTQDHPAILKENDYLACLQACSSVSKRQRVAVAEVFFARCCIHYQFLTYTQNDALWTWSNFAGLRSVLNLPDFKRCITAGRTSV